MNRNGCNRNNPRNCGNNYNPSNVYVVHVDGDATRPEVAAFMPELTAEVLDAAALFAALLCIFPRAVTWGNPMNRPDLRKPYGRD